MVLGLVVFSAIAVGVETEVDRSLIGPSGLTKATLIGWQLVYILPVALITNAFFLSVSLLHPRPTTATYRPALEADDGTRASGCASSPHGTTTTSGSVAA